MTAASYLEARSCERRSTFKHVLWAPNTQASLDTPLYTNNEYNTNILSILTTATCANTKIYICEQINN